MSLYITQVNIGSVLDKRIQINDDQIGRLFDIGSNWTKVWVMLRLSINGSATIVSPTLAIGVCNGTTNMFKDATTNNFCGVVSTGNITYTAGTPNYFSATLNNASRVGTTTTTGTGNARLITAVNSDRATMLGVQLRKISSSAVGVRLWGPNNSITGTVHQTYETWIAYSEIATTATGDTFLAPTGYATSTEQSITIDEATNGVLDTLNVSWDQSATTVDISDIGYSVKRL